MKYILPHVQDVKTVRRMGRGLSDHHIVLWWRGQCEKFGEHKYTEDHPFFNIHPQWCHHHTTNTTLILNLEKLNLIHILCGLPLPLLRSTFAWYTLLTSLSFHILSTCPNHFNMFLSILTSTLNLHPHLSLIIVFLALSTLLMPHMFLKHIFSNTSIFPLFRALNAHVSKPYTTVGITTQRYYIAGDQEKRKDRNARKSRRKKKVVRF